MSKITIWVIAAVLVVVAATAVFGRGGGAAPANTLRVGVIVPLTGSFAVNGEEGRNAMQLAADEINGKGGILGKEVALDIEDGRCDTTAALNAWHKLVDTDGVKVVLGGHCSTETLAITPLAAPSHILTLPDITSAVDIQGEGEWVFRNSPSSRYTAVKAADYVVQKLGYKTLSIVTEEKDFPKTYSQFFADEAKKLGATVSFNESFAPNTKDFRTLVTKMKNVPADAVLVSTQGGSTAGLIAKQMHDLGVEKFQIYNAGFNFTDFKTGSDGYVPAHFTAVFPYANPDAPKVKAFLNEYRAKYGKEPTYNLYYVSSTYDMVYRLKSAYEACGTLSDMECVRNQFKNATSYEAVSGTVMVSSDYSPKGAVMSLGSMTLNPEGTTKLEEIR